jgi:zinc protease
MPNQSALLQVITDACRYNPASIRRINKVRRKLGIILLLGLLPVTAWAASIQEFKLANGMKVVVQEDHRSPVVVSQVWYRAGSIDEFNGTTGVAHVLEHMMFKGTKKVPAGQFSRIVAAAGGRENAFTSRDVTVYFQQLEKSRLELSMKLEADRMVNLNMSDREFAKEIQVVMEERRWRTEDKPQALVGEQLMTTTLQAHPYGRPVIGWMNDLENMKAQDARDWYKRWYAPNNATLVVVGDVRPQEVFRLAKKYFGPLKPQKLPERKPQNEPEQKGERRVVVKAPARLPYLAMAYPVPALRSPEDWEPYALEVLAGVLDGHAASRLNRDLVRRDRVAVSVGAGYDAVSRGPALFEFDGSPSEGSTVDDLEIAIRGQIEQLKEAGITEEELQRVKAQVIAADVYQRDSMFYQAMQIGMLESTPGLSWRMLDDFTRRLQAVTAGQVQTVARKYLVDDKLTVAVLDPQPIDENAPKHKEAPHGRH